jgi:hypothetical protein
MNSGLQKLSLTLTLSHPTGEGTAMVSSVFFQTSLANTRLAFTKDGEQFPLSHRMGEGRGEGDDFPDRCYALFLN